MNLITGATGLLGSHLAEQLVAGKERVRALVRPTSDTRFLQTLGVELVTGDLTDPASLRQAMAGASVVYHAAAKVGDWGTKEEFRRYTIDGTRNVLDACVACGVRRLVHISSTSAYGHPEPSDDPIDETRPLGTKFWVWDDYTRAKIAAERLVWDAVAKHGLAVTVIRPSWIYGPHDRLSIFRIAGSLRRGRVRIIGTGTNRMNTVYAGNVAAAAILAARQPHAAGQAYNVTNDGVVTQREYFNTYADALDLPRPTKHLPYRVAYAAATCLEAVFRLLRVRRPPFITRYATWLIGRQTFYSTAKAERELGWRPLVSFPEGVARTVAWYREQVAGKQINVASPKDG
jgi:nucleoside-diphosphate-sugar epimerase